MSYSYAPQEGRSERLHDAASDHALFELLASAETPPTAPHVLTRVHAATGHDIARTAAALHALTAEQRAGLRALPDPLPVQPETPADASADRSIDALEERWRHTLLAVVLSTTGHLGVLEALTGWSAHALADAPIGRHLQLHAGTFRLADPALGIRISTRARPDQLRAAHRALAGVHVGRGELTAAAWHRARAALQPEPEAASRLVHAARLLAARGRTHRAFLLADEAASHLTGAHRDEALQVAGTAALAEGRLLDAAERLGALFPHGEPRSRYLALGGYLVARAMLDGVAPTADAAGLRPLSDDPEVRRAWSQAAGLAAVLAAERGDRAAMGAWLNEVRTADADLRAHGRLRRPVVALCWLLVGETGEDEHEHDGQDDSFFASLHTALRSALRGDSEQGIAAVSWHRLRRPDGDDPVIAGFAHSPLAGAYRGVVESLILVWAGKVAQARDRLRVAALQHPVSLPFAGLGATLARRLDRAVLGRPGSLSRGVVHAASAQESMIDRALHAQLRGATEEASVAVRLWRDRSPRPEVLAVPGADERDGALAIVAPPDLRTCADLLGRLHAPVDVATRIAITEQARSIRSPFARARVELALGDAAVLGGDERAGRLHLRAAIALFADAGADAWERAASRRLHRLDVSRADDVEPATAHRAAHDPLAACRALWSALLTARELEVAMMMVQGMQNRAIAAGLGLSVRTIEVHTTKLFAKLGVRSRVELTVLAHRVDRVG